MDTRSITAGALEIAYHETGPADGWPCVLCHGFPYDIHAFAAVAPILARGGARVIVPYLRGYGPTRFLTADTPRSGEQAALGADLLALMDALGLNEAVLAGYDWGGRAACIVAALWPDRVRALVSANAYNIQNIAQSWEPASPRQEAALWYQYYFHSERGRRGLERDRRGVARLLWQMWSPSWRFTDEDFETTAAAFDNPDFVDVVIHSYRHRYGLVPGDPAVAHIETQLTAQPPISVPALTIDGADDGVSDTTEHHAKMFSGPHRHEIWGATGHNIPQEQPERWASAVVEARKLGR